MKAKFLCCLGLACAVAIAAAAEDKDKPQLKIGVVSMEKVFQDYFKTKVANSNLKKQAEVFRDYLNQLYSSKEKLDEEFKKLRDEAQNVIFSDLERENKRIAAQDKFRQLKSKEAEIQQYNREKSQQIDEDYKTMRNKILAEIREVVQARGRRGGFTLILDASGKTLNDIPAVVYSQDGIDLTASVLTELNLGHAAELKQYENLKDNPKDTGR